MTVCGWPARLGVGARRSDRPAPALDPSPTGCDHRDVLGAFAQADFYLAASALIPALALADIVIWRRWVALGNPQLVDRLNRVAPWAEFAGALIWGVFFSCAEFACLRSLELGKTSFGAPAIVWVALAIEAVQTVGYFAINKLGEALPSRFLAERPRLLRLWRD